MGYSRFGICLINVYTARNLMVLGKDYLLQWVMCLIFSQFSKRGIKRYFNVGFFFWLLCRYWHSNSRVTVLKLSLSTISSLVSFLKPTQVNTDGLVLRGWYNCLTLAIYGSVDRVITHERESPPPPPPPPPPPQQQPGLKRNPKHGESSEKTEIFLLQISVTVCHLKNKSPILPHFRLPWLSFFLIISLVSYFLLDLCWMVLSSVSSGAFMRVVYLICG